ncbi:TPA: aldo/keto reductase [Candidatus Poribacteria bacterium]|nr:aldo/keto reductase [Candidatus Poribacteria bacterium]
MASSVKTLDSFEKRRLGRTNVMVNPFGLGGAGFGKSNSDEEVIEAIHQAIELGIDYIDTSPLYGESERRIGFGLEGGWRDKVFLATKTGTGVIPKNYTADWTYRSVERSLKLLKTDMLDLVQIHDPDDLESALAPDGALSALKDLKEQGVIRGSPILFGLLSNRPLAEKMKRRNLSPDDPEIVKIRQLSEWTAERGVKLLSLALQYCMRDSRVGVILVGVRNRQQLEENVMSVLETLPENIMEELANDFGI